MLNLGPIVNQGNSGGRGVAGLGNPGGGRGLQVQEIREEGGSKTLAIRRGGGGGCGFFGITQCKNILKETLATERFEK